MNRARPAITRNIDQSVHVNYSTRMKENKSVTALGLSNTFNSLNNSDSSLLAHLFLSYNLANVGSMVLFFFFARRCGQQIAEFRPQVDQILEPTLQINTICI